MMNGTRQGSVLSPYLVCVYMRGITKDVTTCGTGCHIGGMPACILMYADDVALLAPSWHAQQKLMHVCSESVARVGMTFNATKSTTMIFPPYRAARRVLSTFPNFTYE